MITEKELAFLVSIKEFVKNNPSLLAAVLQVIEDGTIEAIKEQSDRAADMESVAAMALNTRMFKGNQKFIADKLRKWSGKSALRWDDQIAALEKSQHDRR